MAKSGRLRFREVRAAFRLLGEVRDLGVDPAAWRSHAIRELARLVGGSVAMTLDLRDFLPGRVPAMIAPIDLGWDSDRERSLFLGYLESDLPKADPSAVAWVSRMARRRFSTAIRRELTDDREWYGSPIVTEGRRSCRIDDPLISCAAIGGTGRVQGFQFYRPWGARGFDIRERDLVRLFHLELLRALRYQPPDAAAALPPRLRPVYAALIRGRTSKQVARGLGLSVHTVDAYIKDLFRRFGVGSRPQLLALRLNDPAPGRIVLPPELAGEA